MRSVTSSRVRGLGYATAATAAVSDAERFTEGLLEECRAAPTCAASVPVTTTPCHARRCVAWRHRPCARRCSDVSIWCGVSGERCDGARQVRRRVAQRVRPGLTQLVLAAVTP